MALLVLIVALALALIVAVIAVSIGMVRTGALGLLTGGGTGRLVMAVYVVIVIAGIGSVVAAWRAVELPQRHD